jgi:hypothetical protein
MNRVTKGVAGYLKQSTCQILFFRMEAWSGQIEPAAPDIAAMTRSRRNSRKSRTSTSLDGLGSKARASQAS